MKFEELLDKDSPLLAVISERGFEEATEIQEKSIPVILDGKDVIAGAATGSGKTLAFAAGIVKNVKAGKGLQAMVLTPTRELAEQVGKELKDFSKELDLGVAIVYGGVGINPQIKKLESAEVVVATPGRMLDHMGRGSISLGDINTIVLDEADRMLDMGFRDDVKQIIAECPRERQVLLFSATISADIMHLSSGFMKGAVEVSAEDKVDPTKLLQVYYDVRDNMKFSVLKHLLENEKSHLVIVFCNTRNNVDFIVNNLRALDINASPIHGGITQDKRSKTLAHFKSESKTNILVATDVAARGLHIEGITHVYNYDAPDDPKEYIHRIGRTARAGAEGKVINIISMRDYENFNGLRPKELGIKQEETPYVEMVPIKWIPGRQRGNQRHERFGVGGPSRGGRGGSSSGRGSRGGSSRGGGGSYGGSRGGSSRGRDGGSRDSGRGRDSGRSYSGGSRDSGGRDSGHGRDRRDNDSRGSSGGRDSGHSYGGRDSGRSHSGGSSYGGGRSHSRNGSFSRGSSHSRSRGSSSGGSSRGGSRGRDSRTHKRSSGSSSGYSRGRETGSRDSGRGNSHSSVGKKVFKGRRH
tara:strand:+ start:2665 stop:4410 length:1746 start_codon:yes stop_codon:yes gene_type:complete